MGDVITRFKLETTQFDSKLRDEAKRLSDLTNQLSLAGKDFNKFAQQHVETARSFGQVSSGATNLKDKLRDLVGAYNQVAKAYNAMSKEQQQTDYGKAMAESLQKLQGDIRQTKEEMNAMPGVLDKLTDRFTVNIDAIKLFNVGLQAAEGALKVAKDAFFASEANVDEWGRIVQSSKSVYEGFLTAINTGDISGYLSRIDEIVSAARAAYNELDRLGTMKTIQAPAMSAQQAENERMRMMIQTGRYIAPMDGRKATMQNGQLLTPDQIRRIEQMLQGGMQKMVTLVGNEVNQTGKAIDALYTSQAKDLGLSLKEFRKGTSSMAEFDKRRAGYDQYQQWRAAHTTIDQQSGREIVARGNPFAQYAKWGAFRVDGDRYNQLVQLIQQRNQQQSSAYGMQSQAYRAINRAEGITLKGIMGGGGSGGGSGGSSNKNLPTLEDFWLQMSKNDMKLQDQKAAGDLVKDMPSPYQMMFDEIKKRYLDKKDFDYGKDISKEWKVDSKGNLTNKSENRAQESMARDLNKFTGYAEKTLGGVSSIVGGLSQLGVEIPKGLQDVLGGIQGITSIVTGIASLVAMIEALSTVQTTESTIKSIPVIGWALAGGGIIHAANGYVPGNNYSGDQVPALLNSGELVLNKAQQNALANELQGNGMQNMRLRTEVSGRNLIVVIENDLKARGKGQLATFKG